MPGTDPGQFSFLIVGAGRGGTSLLMGLLDQHPDLEVAMEMFAMDSLMGYGLEVPAAEIKSEMAMVRCKSFLDKCKGEAAKHPAKIWGNKITTEQIYGLEDHNSANGTTLPYLDLFFNQILTGIKVIYILRDGRTCVRSKISRTAQGVEHACQRWKYSVHVMRFLLNNHPYCYVVRYEELVSSPETTLTSVCRFLDIDYHVSMLRGVNSEKMKPEYRNTLIKKENLSLKGTPRSCIPLLIGELHEVGYINKWQYWFNRARYSSRWSEAFAILLALIAIGAYWL